MTRFVLKGKGELSQANFVVDGDSVHVTALIGAATYIDRPMSKEDARKEWKRLKERGWKKIEAKEALSVQKLKMYIYD